LSKKGLGEDLNDDIDLEIVWNTVRDDLPELRKKIEEMI